MKRFLISIISLSLIFSTTSSAFAKKAKLSKACRKGTTTCINADVTGKTTEESLQACISCCTSDTTNIKSEKCFNFCTDKCALEFSGMTISITGK